MSYQTEARWQLYETYHIPWSASTTAKMNNSTELYSARVAAETTISRLELALRSAEAGIMLIPANKVDSTLIKSLKKAHGDATAVILSLRLALLAPTCGR